MGHHEDGGGLFIIFLLCVFFYILLRVKRWLILNYNIYVVHVSVERFHVISYITFSYSVRFELHVDDTLHLIVRIFLLRLRNSDFGFT